MRSTRRQGPRGRVLRCQTGARAPGVPLPGLALGGRPVVGAARLWSAGAGAAVAAGTVVIAGMSLVRGVLEIPVPPPGGGGTGMYVLWAVAGALLATAALHILVAVAARPVRSFAWISGLAVAAATSIPFTAGGRLDGAVATAAIDVVAGFAGLGLLCAAAVPPSRPAGAGEWGER